LPTLPNEQLGPQDLEFRHVYADGTPIKGIPYKARLADGTVRNGSTDGSGLAHESGVPPGPVVVEYGNDPNKPESSVGMDIDGDLKKIFAFRADA